MENDERTGSASTPDLVVRDYAFADYSACRMLWVELIEHHRRIYEEPSIGGDDPGGGFDHYLSGPERVASWVADLSGRVVGLTGLLDRGTSGEVEPVVVTEGLRSRGIGKLLIDRVVAEAVARRYERLTIRPVARNVSAIRRFYDAGFQTLGGHVDLTIDLADRRHHWLEGAHLHGLAFRY
jgi:GNAT superfamily N-acetyltransferase